MNNNSSPAPPSIDSGNDSFTAVSAGTDFDLAASDFYYFKNRLEGFRSKLCNSFIDIDQSLKMTSIAFENVSPLMGKVQLFLRYPDMGLDDQVDILGGESYSPLLEIQQTIQALLDELSSAGRQVCSLQNQMQQLLDKLETDIDNIDNFSESLDDISFLLEEALSTMMNK